MTNPPEIYAWAAGLIDGEGYVKIPTVMSCGKPITRPYIQVNMTCEKTVRRLHEIFGVGSVMDPRPRENPKHKWITRWAASNRMALHVAECCIPYSVTKKQEFQNIIDWYKNALPPGAHVQGVNNASAKLTDEDVRLIRQIYASGGTAQRDLAARYGVSQTIISKVVNRTRWAHVI